MTLLYPNGEKCKKRLEKKRKNDTIKMLLFPIMNKILEIMR